MVRLLSAKHAALELDMSESSVRRHVPSVKIGRLVRFDVDAIEVDVAQHIRQDCNP